MGFYLNKAHSLIKFSYGFYIGSLTMRDVLYLLLVQFLTGVKDSVYGVFVIYSLDLKIQRNLQERQKRLNDAIEARQPRRYGGRTPPPTKPRVIKEPRMINRVFQSCALGGFIWLTVWIFTALIVPWLQQQTNWFLTVVPSVFNMTSLTKTQEELQRYDKSWTNVEIMLHLIFSSLWVLPLYIICKLINIVWFSDISNSIYRALYGKTRPFPSLSVAFADLIYSLTFEIVFFIQAQFVNVVPMMNAEIEHLQIQVMCYIAYTFYCIHVCLLYAIYAFEYKWFNMGIELRNRIELIERHWPYFCGFGLPMFLLTNVAFTYYPLVASACVYSSVFPFFIVSGTRASTPRSEAPFTLYLTKPSISFCNLLFNNAFRRPQAN